MSKPIHIPAPCHENWANFTPTEQGAFCQSCHKEVIDFSYRSNDAIEAILEQNNRAETCGRFTRSQLDNYNIWQVNRNRQITKFQSRFIMALLLVFGLNLFSCQSSDTEQVIQNYQSQLEVVLPEIAAPISTTDPQTLTDGPITSNIKESTSSNEFLKGEVAPQNIEYEIGKIAHHDSIYDSNPQKTDNLTATSSSDTNSTTTEPIVGLRCENFIMGDVIEVYEPEIQPIEEPVPPTVPKISSPIQPDLIQLTVFPNPSSAETTLALQVKKASLYHIEITNLNGQLIKTIYEGHLEVSDQQWPIDVSGLAPGQYLITTSSEQSRSTVKFTKL